MIEDILPAAVSAAEAFGDPPDAVLFPEEAAAIAKAGGGRRREFTTARACAHRALTGLGVPPGPVLRGERGAPRWPDGIVGSITHCADYRAAVAARAGEILALGIDAEPNDVLPGGVLDLISLPPERAMLAGLAAVPGICWDRLLFSAKESVYKAWFPRTGRWLGFEDAQITINPGNGTFTAALLVPPAETGRPGPPGYAGRWLERDGFLLTAVAVAAPAAGPGH
jgi:4'-phosphopantetheinyl transferase EntD